MVGSLGQARKAKQQEISLPPVPHAGSHLWQAFLCLDDRRSSNGFSVNPISYGEIESFMRLNALSLTPSEVAVLAAMDNEYLSARLSGQTSAPKIMPATKENTLSIFRSMMSPAKRKKVMSHEPDRHRQPGAGGRQ